MKVDQNTLMIGLAVVVLMSFFATFMSTKTWRIGQVILVFFVFLASGVFWYMSAATLQARSSWGDKAKELQGQVKLQAAIHDALISGTDDEEFLSKLDDPDLSVGRRGKKQLQAELDGVLAGRNRVWVNCQPAQREDNGAATVTIEFPNPHHVQPDTIVFVFEEGSVAGEDGGQGAQYLGEFKVTATAEESVTLEPAFKMSPRQAARVTGSTLTWVIYETMPTDRHDIFAEMEATELERLLPAATVEQYKKDGKIAADDDPAERVVGYNRNGLPATSEEQDKVVERRYQRQLRDYEQLFRHLDRQRYLDFDRTERLKRDTARLTDAIALAESDITKKTAEVEGLKADLARFKFEVQVIERHHAVVRGRVTALTARVAQLRESVQQKVAELERLQLALAKQIDEQTTKAEQPAAGRKLQFAGK